MTLKTHMLHLLYIALLGCGPLPSLPPGTSNATAAPIATGTPTSDAPLKIVALDIGEGDATLVRTPNGHNFLIDAGPAGSGKRVTLPYLMKNGITRLDHISASHYDSDHIGGLPEILAGTDGMLGTADDIIVTGSCWDHGDSETKHTAAFASYSAATKNCERVAIPGDRVDFDDGVSVEVMAINGVSKSGRLATLDPSDENGTSMVLLITYGNFSYVTTGDLPGGGGDPPFDTIDEETPLAKQIGHVDVLHLGHHGSHTASNLTFLQTLSPNAAIISAGDGNTYYHPHPSVLQRLAGLNIPVYQTERGHKEGTAQSHVMNGNVVIESDGESFEVKPEQ